MDADETKPEEQREAFFLNQMLTREYRHGYQQGFIQALRDYGIWNDGVQTIGCLSTPIKEIIKNRFPEEK